MDRKRFLELCQRVSALPDDVSGVKCNITPDLIVNFDYACLRIFPHSEVRGDILRLTKLFCAFKNTNTVAQEGGFFESQLTGSLLHIAAELFDLFFSCHRVTRYLGGGSDIF